MPSKHLELDRNVALEAARTITEGQRQKAIAYLTQKHAAGELPGFSDVEGDTLELFIDLLGLNGRMMRNTVTKGAAEKYLQGGKSRKKATT